MTNIDLLIRMTPYFTIIHHTAGRLRVKIDKSIVDADLGISFDDIVALPDQVDGLNGLKINKVMATATITYDPKILKKESWEALIAGEENDLFANLTQNL